MIWAIVLLSTLLTAMLPASSNAVTGEPTVQLIATGQDRAIVIVDGQRLVLDGGASAKNGVLLIRADSQEAVLMIGGEELVLRSDAVAAPVLEEANSPPAAQPTSVTLWADRDGFFHADGRINGKTVRFLVDTGANTIALSSELADKLGIDYQKGSPGFATTASGVTPVKMIKLRQISVGGITGYDLEAGVIQGNHPETPLLGAPFLNQVKMIRNGRRMELHRQ